MESMLNDTSSLTPHETTESHSRPLNFLTIDSFFGGVAGPPTRYVQVEKTLVVRQAGTGVSQKHLLPNRLEMDCRIGKGDRWGPLQEERPENRIRVTSEDVGRVRPEGRNVGTVGQAAEDVIPQLLT